jgi:hypothetical protein
LTSLGVTQTPKTCLSPKHPFRPFIGDFRSFFSEFSAFIRDFFS